MKINITKSKIALLQQASKKTGKQKLIEQLEKQFPSITVTVKPAEVPPGFVSLEQSVKTLLEPKTILPFTPYECDLLKAAKFSPEQYLAISTTADAQGLTVPSFVNVSKPVNPDVPPAYTWKNPNDENKTVIMVPTNYDWSVIKKGDIDVYDLVYLYMKAKQFHVGSLSGSTLIGICRKIKKYKIDLKKMTMLAMDFSGAEAAILANVETKVLYGPYKGGGVTFGKPGKWNNPSTSISVEGAGGGMAGGGSTIYKGAGGDASFAGGGGSASSGSGGGAGVSAPSSPAGMGGGVSSKTLHTALVKQDPKTMPYPNASASYKELKHLVGYSADLNAYTNWLLKKGVSHELTKSMVKSYIPNSDISKTMVLDALDKFENFGQHNKVSLNPDCHKLVMGWDVAAPSPAEKKEADWTDTSIFNGMMQVLGKMLGMKLFDPNVHDIERAILVADNGHIMFSTPLSPKHKFEHLQKLGDIKGVDQLFIDKGDLQKAEFYWAEGGKTYPVNTADLITAPTATLFASMEDKNETLTTKVIKHVCDQEWSRYHLTDSSGTLKIKATFNGATDENLELNYSCSPEWAAAFSTFILTFIPNEFLLYYQTPAGQEWVYQMDDATVTTNVQDYKEIGEKVATWHAKSYVQESPVENPADKWTAIGNCIAMAGKTVDTVYGHYVRLNMSVDGVTSAGVPLDLDVVYAVCQSLVMSALVDEMTVTHEDTGAVIKIEADPAHGVHMVDGLNTLAYWIETFKVDWEEHEYQVPTHPFVKSFHHTYQSAKSLDWDEFDQTYGSLPEDLYAICLYRSERHYAHGLAPDIEFAPHESPVQPALIVAENYDQLLEHAESLYDVINACRLARSQTDYVNNKAFREAVKQYEHKKHGPGIHVQATWANGNDWNIICQPEAAKTVFAEAVKHKCAKFRLFNSRHEVQIAWLNPAYHAFWDTEPASVNGETNDAKKVNLLLGRWMSYVDMKAQHGHLLANMDWIGMVKTQKMHEIMEAQKTFLRMKHARMLINDFDSVDEKDRVVLMVHHSSTTTDKKIIHHRHLQNYVDALLECNIFRFEVYTNIDSMVPEFWYQRAGSGATAKMNTKLGSTDAPAHAVNYAGKVLDKHWPVKTEFKFTSVMLANSNPQGFVPAYICKCCGDRPTVIGVEYSIATKQHLVALECHGVTEVAKIPAAVIGTMTKEMHLFYAFAEEQAA